MRYIEKTKNLYEFISFVMVLLFGILPVYASVSPGKYGKFFKTFSRIEITVLFVCIVCFLVLFMIKAFTSTFKYSLSPVKDSLKNYFSSQPYAILFIFSLVLTTISALRAPDRARAMAGSDFRPDGLMMYFCFAALFVFSSSLKNKTYKNIVLITYGLSFFFVSLIMIQQYYGLIGSAPKAETPLWAEGIKSFYTEKEIRYGHFYKGMTASFYNANHMGYYIALCSAIFSGWLIKSKKVLSIVVFGIGSAWSYWVLIMNNTFGAFIAVFVIILVCGIYLSVSKKAKPIRAFMPLVVFLFVCIFFIGLSPANKEASIITNIIQLKSDVNKIAQSDDKSDVSAGSGRWKLWVKATEMISDRPLLGYGADNIKKPSQAYGMSIDRSHNEFLEIASASGIPCAVFYYAGVLFAFLKALKRKDSDGGSSSALPIAMAVGAYFISSLVGVFLFYTACHLFVMLGLMRE